MDYHLIIDETLAELQDRSDMMIRHLTLPYVDMAVRCARLYSVEAHKARTSVGRDRCVHAGNASYYARQARRWARTANSEAHELGSARFSVVEARYIDSVWAAE